MDPTSNFLNLLRFQPAETVPSAPPLYELRYYGANHEGWENALAHDNPVGTQWTDIWGVGWRKIHAGVMGMPVHNPLADPAALRSYRWPDPAEERISGQIERMAEVYRREHDPAQELLSCSHRDTLWEKSYMLVGMENMMVYFKREPDYAREVLRRIMDFQLGMAAVYIGQGVRFASLGDDLGTQSGALLGPRIVQEFLLPEYRRLFQYYKERGVLVGFHSCGNLDSVLAMFLDLGVDILNPVQATANNLDALRVATKGRMALQGGVSSAVVMEGPVTRIEAEVRRRLWQLGRDGGYICCPDQGMPYPKEHEEAVRKAVQRWGRYPLQPYP